MPEWFEGAAFDCRTRQELVMSIIDEAVAAVAGAEISDTVHGPNHADFAEFIVIVPL